MPPDKSQRGSRHSRGSCRLPKVRERNLWRRGREPLALLVTKDQSLEAVRCGTSNTQNEPPWLTCFVMSAMSPPHSGTAPP